MEKSIKIQESPNNIISKEQLDALHETVPVDYYERGVVHSRLQRAWHTRRFREVERLLSGKTGPYLDVGCHSGYLTNFVARILHSPAVGVDISSEAIAHATVKYPADTWVTADLFHGIPLPDASFRVVTAFDLLEHLISPSALLTEIARVLQPGGLFLFTIPHETLLFRIVWKWWTVFGGATWRHVHVQEFDRAKIQALLASSGFEVRSYHQTMCGMYQYFLCQKR